ncbi:pentatricopeptide repeat-containing protein 2, mitochondrial [Calliopsis andreniformis]|uniref:pentatricopeptide repeat-containing protein 2, mitochondrial n=1 Tax=Calliopsis andreniformis TaxID=337506 RepID=UPI003FCCEA56
MAISIRGLCKLNIGLVNNVISKTNVFSAGVRFLYTEKTLGVTAYENTRFLFHNQFLSIEDAFREKMSEVCTKDDGVVFTEDLKAMLHLAQKSEKDMELVIKMIEKYQTDANLKFGTYNFGPIVMRMFYYLNEPTLALAAFSNPALESFFSQKSTAQILMCLLYKHDMFNEMRTVYDKMSTTDTLQTLNRFCITVLLAACYKQNTEESFQYALNSWKSLVNNSIRTSCRCNSLLAGLALKQNAPEISLEILGMVERPHFVDVRCLKILVFMTLKKYVQIIPIFKSTLEQEITSQNKQTYFSDVINTLEEHLKSEDQKGVTELLELIDHLRKQERVTSHITLEQHLLRPVNISPLNQNKGRVRRFHRRDDNTSKIGLRNVL